METTPTAAACLGCQTTDGYRNPNAPEQPVRTRGLCNTCYSRAYYHGTYTDYPACGPRPVPGIVITYLDEPLIPRPRPDAPVWTWKDAEWDERRSFAWNRDRQCRAHLETFAVAA